jgi:hypothetical protein
MNCTEFADRPGPFRRAAFGAAACLATAVLTTPATARPNLLADTPIGVPACQSGQVAVSASNPVSASTHRGLPLNFSLAPDASPCSLAGYPGVDSGTGGPQLHAERTRRGFLGGLPSGVDESPTVILWPSAQAHAIVEGQAVDAQGNQCPTYTDLRVTPPDTTQTVTVAASIDTCELQIHPITGN